MRTLRTGSGLRALAGVAGLTLLLGFLAPAASAANHPAAPSGVRFEGVSRAVRDLPRTRSQPHGSRQPFLGRRPHHGQPTAPVDPLAAVQQAATATAASAMPATGTSFDGISEASQSAVSGEGVVPPDTNGDVGPSDYVQAVNLAFEVFSKTGTSLAGPVAFASLWASTGSTCGASANLTDPVVLYDRADNRWILSIAEATAPYYECLAVSQTGDPTGAYYLYEVSISSSYLGDYPKLGIWLGGLYLSVNLYSSSSYIAPGLFAFDLADLVAGSTSVAEVALTTASAAPSVTDATGTSSLTSSDFTLLPANQTGATPPPNGASEYFAELSPSNDASLDFFAMAVDFSASPPTGSLTSPQNVPVAPYNPSFGRCSRNSTGCVPQPSTTQKLDPISDRLMFRLEYRNVAGRELLVVDHTVNVATTGGLAGSRWYELQIVRTGNPEPSSVQLVQEGTYLEPNDTTNAWMASVNLDRAGDIAMGYSVSDATSTYPGIRYAGRLSTDPIDTLSQTEQVLQVGNGAQTGTYRWGDYSSMSVDPTDDCTFWYTQEYYATTSSYGWQTRIASFRFPSCALALSPPTSLNFGDQQEASTSAARTVSLSDTLPTGQNLSVSSLSISGPGAASFGCQLASGAACSTVSPSSPLAVSAGGQADLQLTFSAPAGTPGTESATLTITSDAGASDSTASETLALTGTGVPAPGYIDGTLDGSAGSPVGQICVLAQSTAGGNPQLTTLSTANTSPNFTLSGLEPGLWKLRFADCSASPSYATVWYAGSGATTEGMSTAATVAVTSNATTSIGTVNLPAVASLSGTVDGGGVGLAGICLQAFAPDGTLIAQTTTGAGGSYQLTGLPTGSPGVDLEARDCTSTSWATQWYSGADSLSAATALTLTAGPNSAPTITLAASVAVAGTVTEAGSAVAIAQVCVAAYSAGGGQLLGQASTDSTGAYTVPGLPPSVSVDLRFTDCSGAGLWGTQYYAEASGFNKATAVSTGTAGTSGVNETLSPAGFVTGTVTAAGNDLAGICVTAWTASSPSYLVSWTTTAADGGYSLGGLPAGSFDVRFQDCQNGVYPTQWYDGQTSQSAANPVSVTSGQVTGAIDASL